MLHRHRRRCGGVTAERWKREKAGGPPRQRATAYGSILLASTWELVAERGVEVDASRIRRWVQDYAPWLYKRCRPHPKPSSKRYRIDETYIKVKGDDKYLCRALDSTGQTIEFLVTAKRDAAIAKRFLRWAIDASGNAMPRVQVSQ
jgi:transposase-like protein